MPILKCHSGFWVGLQFPLSKELAAPLNKDGWEHCCSHLDPICSSNCSRSGIFACASVFSHFENLKKNTNAQTLPPETLISSVLGGAQSSVLFENSIIEPHVGPVWTTAGLHFCLLTWWLAMYCFFFGEHNLCCLAAVCVFAFFMAWEDGLGPKNLQLLENTVTAWCSVLPENGSPVYTAHYMSQELLYISTSVLQHCSDYMV